MNGIDHVVSQVLTMSYEKRPQRRHTKQELGAMRADLLADHLRTYGGCLSTKEAAELLGTNHKVASVAAGYGRESGLLTAVLAPMPQGGAMLCIRLA